MISILFMGSKYFICRRITCVCIGSQIASYDSYGPAGRRFWSLHHADGTSVPTFLSDCLGCSLGSKQNLIESLLSFLRCQ